MTKRAIGPEISVVVPVYNEQGNAGPLAREIDAVLRAMGKEYEIIFVNDGSTDGTLEELQQALTDVPRLRILDLDGNFGEAAALTAGFQAARGDVIVTLDGDGQNDPNDLPRLWERFQRGAVVVSGWRQRRQDGFWRRVLPSRLANWLIARVTGIPTHDNGCGLKIYRAAVAKRVQLPKGFHRFLPAILGVQGDEVAEVPVRDRQRRHGASHYGLNRTFIVLRDLLAVPFLVTHPRAFEVIWALVAAMAALGGTVLAIHGNILGTTVAAVFTLLAYAIWWNVRRFNRAQRLGVFRVRREFTRLGEGALLAQGLRKVGVR
ncbi:MAG: hypothetical protein KatS3mg077_3398 [Candidatus Binatia bacterium]|nr:MAG: hypothetical protein KatS3mg077_3398 [Candidatus Binatia bacterium]